MELSREREQELRLHLQKNLYVKLGITTLKKIIKDVNHLRTGKLHLHDPYPQMEGLATYATFLEVFDLFDFLVL